MRLFAKCLFECISVASLMVGVASAQAPAKPAPPAAAAAPAMPEHHHHGSDGAQHENMDDHAKAQHPEAGGPHDCMNKDGKAAGSCMGGDPSSGCCCHHGQHADGEAKPQHQESKPAEPARKAQKADQNVKERAPAPEPAPPPAK